ncbi:hypothetical protein BD408DRAFT_415215 [Parasitella parasitica]|nr:hypothetical protein BD408DRAFT_415215 [Parasitella parasitica]
MRKEMLKDILGLLLEIRRTDESLVQTTKTDLLTKSKQFTIEYPHHRSRKGFVYIPRGLIKAVFNISLS